jgi:hypothetical protein
MPSIASRTAAFTVWLIGCLVSLSLLAEEFAHPHLPEAGLIQEAGPPIWLEEPAPLEPTPAPLVAAPADEPPLSYFLGGTGRAYYLNDQRIEFTGQEATFGVEGVIVGGLLHRAYEWNVEAFTEIFLNQPFDRNVLVDSPLRESFAPNFDVDPLQISQLYISVERDDLRLAAGRFVTPFGRFYYPIFQNNFGDSPFIREQAILYRETGIAGEWTPGWLSLTAALTNGGPERDTNSSKAFIGRVGVDFERFAAGASIKEQDGIGSEGQKTFNSHVGLDGMIRLGERWTLSGEVIYDEYGMRRPGFAQNDIFWGRNIYWRDLNRGLHLPITGVGYYLNLGYEGERWRAVLNYGEFYPAPLGERLHDTPIHRGLIKGSYRITPHWEVYSSTIVENSVPLGFGNKHRHGLVVLAGTQISF